MVKKREGNTTKYIQTMATKYRELFSILTQNLELFIKEVSSKKARLMATEEWRVKDELCHLVFWHENYAANYEALAKNEAPPLPEGMSTINRKGVLSLRRYSIKELINRLRHANKSLFRCIVEKEVPRMTYSKGGRTYESDYFLEMIARHIITHTKHVRRAK